MARGWESKSVESQQSQQPSERKIVDTAEEKERASKRASLELSKRRVERELESAHSEVHRTALKNALEFLDGELAKLV